MNIFDLEAKISLDADSYEDALNDAGKKTESFGSKLRNGLVGAAKVGAKALAAVSTAALAGVTALTKAAVANYSEYEQLVGGVETLFKKSAGTVQKYAANAYKTAGLSANQYMETVTSFSASLLQSLGGDTEKAAKYADMAITDMSDNANKMGSDMSSIQAAYQGFAKQNYTMLDNLKLGYGGTKTEMERLVKDAEKLNKKFKATRNANGDLAMSYSDIVDAIHIVQTNMDITGTTAKEASTTIQGSISSMKSAWENLVTGLADPNADIGKLMANMVNSAKTVLKNLLPAIKQALSAAAKAISEFIPEAAKEIPGLLESIVPDLMVAVESLASVFVDSIPQLVKIGGQIITGLGNAIIKTAPKLVKSGIEAVKQLLKGVSGSTSDAISAISGLIQDILSTIVKELPEFLKMGAKIISELATGLADEIPGFISGIVSIFTDPKNLSAILNAGVILLTSLIGGMSEIIKAIVDVLPDIVNAIVETLTTGTLLQDIVSAGVTLLTALVENAEQIINTICDILPDIINAIVGALTAEDGKLLKDIVNAGVTLLTALVKNGTKIIETICAFLPDIVNSIIDALTAEDGKLFKDIVQAGITLFCALLYNVNDIILAIAAILPDFITQLCDALTDEKFLKSMLDAGIELFLGLLSNIPKIVGALFNSLINLGVELGKTLAKGIKKGIGSLVDLITGRADVVTPGIESAVQSYAREQGWTTAQTTNRVTQYGGRGGKINKTNEDPKKRQVRGGRYVSAYASGTDYASRGWAVVGENGPELMWFNGGERVFPNNETKGKASSLTTAGEQRIIDLLQAILNKTGSNIVLDDGTLVGYVDRSLGASALRKARGN